MDRLGAGYPPASDEAQRGMNASLREPVSASHRERVLRALGVTPWVRRVSASRPDGMAQPDLASSAVPGTTGGCDCVVILPAGCSTRELDLLGRALSAGGAMLARAARLTVSDGQLAANVPEARAYLVFGEAQAHALGRGLPAAALHRAQIVLADEPALVLTRADG